MKPAKKKDADTTDAPALCHYCETQLGVKTALVPDGKTLTCPKCGNVYWADDPRGEKSRAKAPGGG